MRKKNTRDYRAYNSNLAYDYNALEREREQRARRPQIRTISHTKVSVRPAERVSVFAIAGFVVVAALLVMILLSYAQLTALSASVVSLESELSSLQTENVTLTAAYERTFDLETVESAATAAGMSKPSSSQIYYLDMTAPDSASVYTVQEHHVLENIFSSFGKGFYSVVEYFA